jgi:hypothetical protein
VRAAFINLGTIRRRPGYFPPLEISEFKTETTCSMNESVNPCTEAKIKLKVRWEKEESNNFEEVELHEVGEGASEFEALFNTLKKALRSRYPQVDQLELGSFSISKSLLPSKDAPSFQVTLQIRFSTQDSELHPFSIKQVGKNQNQTMMLALRDAFELFLFINKPEKSSLNLLAIPRAPQELN